MSKTHPHNSPDATPGQSGEAQVLQHGRSTMIADIRRALPIKHNQLFMLTAESGDIIPGDFGHGLYFHDICFLDHGEIRLQSYAPIVLLANADRGHESVFGLTNPDIPFDDGQVLHKERLGMRRSYTMRIPT